MCSELCSECRPRRSQAAARWVLSSLALLVLAVIAVALPTVAHALDCNAALNYHIQSGPNFGLIGDTERLEITVGTGTITGGATNKMSIARTHFFLDCAGGTLTTAGCTDEGAVVKFVGNIGDVSAGCKDSGGNPIGVTTTHAANSDSPNEVIFTFFAIPANTATTLRLPANTGTVDHTLACAFQFDIQIEARSGDATPNTISEGLTVRSATLDAQCDNTLTPDVAQPGALPLCPICNDNNACTTDTCNQTTGVCSNPPITCNDNNACTTDTCNPADGCHFTPITCDDNNPCTDDSCNSATGCVFTPNSACLTGCPNANPLLGAATDCTVLQSDARKVSVTGPAGQIQGDVCIGAGGKLEMSGGNFILGDVHFEDHINCGGCTTGPTGRVRGANGTSGTVDVNATLVGNAIDDCETFASNHGPASCTENFPGPSPGTLTGTQTITRAPGLHIICVTDVNVGGGQLITLAGTGPGTQYIFVVTGQFKIDGGKIKAGANVTPADIAYNVVGTGDKVAFTGGGGGPGCCKAEIDGTLVAIDRQIALAPGLINGQLCSDQTMDLVSGSGVHCPTP